MLIPLTKGLFAIVDAEDFDRLSKFKWHAWSPKCSPHLTYAVRKIRVSFRKYTKQLMHREILNAAPGTLVDHRNRNGIDNRHLNLRICSTSQNCANSRQHRDARHSSFKGVTLHKSSGLWQASIQCQKIRHYLGWFKEELDAHNAYAAAAKKFFGDYARP